MISGYGKAFIAISVIDLVSTLILIHLGIAEEANPGMAKILQDYGLIGMSLYKIFLTVFIVWAFECYARIQDTSLHYKIAIVFYILAYIILGLGFNLGGFS